MLLRVYEDEGVVKQIAENPDEAPIPEIHKAVYRWTGKIVHEPWSLGAQDVGVLRGMGLDDHEITQWSVRAASQSWFTMCADGAGVDLDGGMASGPAVGRERDIYKTDSRPVVQSIDTEVMALGSLERHSTYAWVETDEQNANYKAEAAIALDRWGVVPNILRALSSLPAVLEQHTYMLQLLERPQSQTLPGRAHALIRATVALANRSSWSHATIDALTAQQTDPVDPEMDEMVADFARTLVLTPWKVTEKYAAKFRAAGLDDAAYLDALNTAAIQNSLDRLCWMLGVPDDHTALLSEGR